MASIPLVFKNLSLIDPQSPHHQQKVDVKVEAGKITRIGAPNSISTEGFKAYEFKNAFISPGWVDMQTHLSDPGHEYKETLNQLASAAKSGGFTAIVCSPNTSPVIDSGQQINSLHLRTRNLGLEFLFTGSITHGAKGNELAEVYDMHQAGAVGFGDGDQPVQKAGIILRALQYLKAFDGLLMLQSEDKSLSGHGQMEEGLVSTRLGLKGVPEIAESISTSRDLDLYGYFPGRVHFQSVTSKESLKRIAEVKEKYSDLSMGTSLFYLFLTDEYLMTFDPNFKVFPPLKTQEGKQAILDALKAGWIDTIGSGHHPQGIEEKNVELEIAEPGMLGLQTFFALANMHLIRSEQISISRLIELIAINPRKILKQPEVVLKEGENANFTIFDTSTEWEFTVDKIPSRAKNSPFIGEKLIGKPIGTYYQGEFHLSNL